MNGFNRMCGYNHAHLVWLNCYSRRCRQQTEVFRYYRYLLGLFFCLLRGTLHLRKVHALFFLNFFFSKLVTDFCRNCFVWPNCGFNISTRVSKCLKGSARPYWRMMLVWKIWLMLITTTKSFELQFWSFRQNMQRDHITWLIIAICGSVKMSVYLNMFRYNHTCVQHVMLSFHFAVCTLKVWPQELR